MHRLKVAEVERVNDGVVVQQGKQIIPCTILFVLFGATAPSVKVYLVREPPFLPHLVAPMSCICGSYIHSE